MTKLRTTVEAAAAVGINPATLHDWTKQGRVTPPPLTFRDGHSVRLWTQGDVKRLREVKARTYRRGRGRKKLRETSIARKSSDKGLHEQSLLNYRGYFLSLLAQGWGEVGRTLPRASTVEELRAALRPLLDQGPPSFRFPPFVRETTQPASRKDLAKTRARLGALSNQRSKVLSAMQSGKDDLAQSTRALRDSLPERRDALRAIQLRHSLEYGEQQREWEKVQSAYSAAETLLADQTAHYVQHQLLDFITSSRRYARSPENLAGAMAGLPEHGASYSFQRCAKHRPLSSHPGVEIFKVIARCWELAHGSREEFLVILPAAIKRISTEHVRRQLETEWWYLREAIVGLSIDTEADDVPHRTFSEYLKRRVSQTPENMVLAKNARLGVEEIETV